MNDTILVYINKKVYSLGKIVQINKTLVSLEKKVR